MSYHDSDTAISLDKLKTVENGVIWYVALIPFFGLLFEIYATGRYLGYFLWALIIVVRILVCFFDNKKLIKMGAWDSPTVSWLALFPVIYIFKRSQLLRRSFATAVVAIIAMYFAVSGNGFTRARAYSDDDYCEMVSEYTADFIQNLPDDENYSENTEMTIGALLNKYCFDRSGEISDDLLVSYSYEKRGNNYYVTAAGTKNGEELIIIFALNYDGYYYDGMNIEEISLGGNIIAGEQRSSMLKEIFMT